MFQTEEEAKENERSPSVALLCAGLLRRGMVYELERVLRVCNGFLCSMSVTVTGVPQGSVLGPILFTMYIKPLSAIIDSHSIIHHSFADDLQLQMSAPPDRISELLHSMQSCISDVKAWATVNMLRLNDSKT